MSTYKHHYFYKVGVDVKNGMPFNEYKEWLTLNNIVRWSYCWDSDKNIRTFYFKFEDNAVLFELTFG